MKILGIDPGSVHTGYGIVGKGPNGSLVRVCDGAISPGPGLTVAERLFKVSEGLTEVIEAHKPDAVSIESVFFAKNVKSAIVLGQARGAALLTAARFGLPVFEYAPTAIKLAVTGYGQAAKEQVGKMVKLLLKDTEGFKKADASDALAIAICHIHHCGINAATGKARLAASSVPR
ncbi:MAG: crossover junction endodeoxyribonuclease RuvC [Deltaproteobacteria bacterium]|nr:crossover junction endodeoxyribonuclease RuvC [Deltaproteobacteria bacterium]